MLDGFCGRIRPSAVLLAEVVGNVVHRQNFGREQLRQGVEAPCEIEAGTGIGGDRSFRLHVLKGFAEYVHLGSGRGFECRHHRVERVILRGHEALPAHHRELGARLRLPRRGLRPGLGEVEQRRPGQCTGCCQRGTALKQRAAGKVVHSHFLPLGFLLLKSLVACPSPHRTDARVTDRVSAGSSRPD